MTTKAVTEARIAAYAKTLRLPVVSRQYKSLAHDAETEGRSYLEFLAALLEQEVIQREQNGVHLRIQQARFPYAKTLDAYDFTAIPTLTKPKCWPLPTASGLASTKMSSWSATPAQERPI